MLVLGVVFVPGEVVASVIGFDFGFMSFMLVVMSQLPVHEDEGDDLYRLAQTHLVSENAWNNGVVMGW